MCNLQNGLDELEARTETLDGFTEWNRSVEGK